jgi:hypothetical protein
MGWPMAAPCSGSDALWCWPIRLVGTGSLEDWERSAWRDDWMVLEASMPEGWFVI